MGFKTSALLIAPADLIADEPALWFCGVTHVSMTNETTVEVVSYPADKTASLAKSQAGKTVFCWKNLGDLMDWRSDRRVDPEAWRRVREVGPQEIGDEKSSHDETGEERGFAVMTELLDPSSERLDDAWTTFFEAAAVTYPSRRMSGRSWDGEPRKPSFLDWPLGR